MNKVCVIGSLNMDLVVSTSKLPSLGETVLGKEFMTTGGGKGANQALAAARLGGEVSMAGCVGGDSYGRALLNTLKGSGVNIDNICIRPDEHTGIAVIAVKDGNNAIIVAQGANLCLTVEKIKRLESVIGRSDILMLQLEIPLDSVECAIDLANRNGVKVLLNPAPALIFDSAMYSKIDILTPNESECGALVGFPVYSVHDAKRALLCLRDKGVKQAVITLGEKGVVYNSGANIVYKPALPVRVVDTTGAGDTFSGALALASANGKSIDDAVDFAMSAAAVAVTRKGAQSAIPYLYEVKNLYQALD